MAAFMKKCKYHGCGAIDRHAHACLGIAKVKATVKFFSIINCGDTHAAITDFSINIGSRCRILSIEGNTIKCGAQSYCGLANRNIMKPFVGSFRSAFTRKHPGRIFILPLQFKYTGGKWKFTRNIFLQLPLEDITPILVLWQNYPGYPGTAQGLNKEWLLQNLVPYLVFKIISIVLFLQRIPFTDQSPAFRS